MAEHKAKPFGGIPLNYEVVGTTTAPTNFKKDSTIWVNTNVALGEHQFSYTKPTKRADGGTLQKGDIWFRTYVGKATCSFNAIKKNYLMVYPYFCRQWNGSKWEKKLAYLYVKSGSRKLIGFEDKPLYTNGTQNVSWTSGKAGSGEGSTGFTSNRIEISATGSYGTAARHQSAFTSSAIDLTGYTTIKVVVSGYAYDNEKLAYLDSNYFCIGIKTNNSGEVWNSTKKKDLNPSSATSDERTVEFDISDVEGSYYIGIGVASYRLYGYANTGYVYSVQLI